jgi:hypothetical protein
MVIGINTNTFSLLLLQLMEVAKNNATTAMKKQNLLFTASVDPKIIALEAEQSQLMVHLCSKPPLLFHLHVITITTSSPSYRHYWYYWHCHLPFLVMTPIITTSNRLVISTVFCRFPYETHMHIWVHACAVYIWRATITLGLLFALPCLLSFLY